MSFMCSRERGGLWCIKNHLREGQTKTVTRKCEFVPGILFVCAALSRHFQDMWVSVRIRSIRRTMQMIYLERSLAFSSSSSSSSFLYFCYFSFFSTSSSLLSCLHFWEFIQRWMLDKKRKRKSIFPTPKKSYILFICQKYWHQPWHNIPEQQTAVFASRGFIIRLVFLRDTVDVEKTVGLKPGSMLFLPYFSASSSY